VTSQFQEIETASDTELAQACSTLLLAWVIPMPDEDVEFIPEAVTRFEETGTMTPEDRKRLIGILHRLLAPNTN
jgi:hypothetical protein